MARSRTSLGLVIVLALVLSGVAAAPPAVAATTTLTNLSHLDFLLDRVEPKPVPGHDTYRLSAEPSLLMPWTYADARDGGGFQRIGGGAFDPVTGHYSQGAYNTDDIARAAVVYLRHWRQTGSSDSRSKAYELLRSVAYLQTSSGADAGRSVLWIQADGELNPSAEPVELPDPSDSGPSYWQARTLWALGEGYAAFARVDSGFAAFLRQRLRLSLTALERDVLRHYGQHRVADGRRVPAWLIVDGADATAEAVLGLAAYSGAVPGDRRARTALARFAEGIAEMSAGGRQQWPYRAILPWAQSRSLWHAWASQASAALARAADVLRRPSLAAPAVREATSFDPTLLTGGGADNGWLPTPVETVQIAYGVDSRVQSLLAVADSTNSAVAGRLAALHASWFFGANRAGEPMYSPRTGVAYDGLEADGRINRNSGAESTIHGLLTMLALDAHPDVRSLAAGLSRVDDRQGLRLVEAEAAVSTTGSIVTPESAWTGESSWSGGAYLRLDGGERATFDLGDVTQPTLVEPVSWQAERGNARSRWRQGPARLGVLRHGVGDQGITAVPGAMLPKLLPIRIRRSGPVEVAALAGPVDLDAILLRPELASATFSGSGLTVTLLFSAAGKPRVHATDSPRGTRLQVYDDRGRLVASRSIARGADVLVPSGGSALLISR